MTRTEPVWRRLAHNRLVWAIMGQVDGTWPAVGQHGMAHIGNHLSHREDLCLSNGNIIV